MWSACEKRCSTRCTLAGDNGVASNHTLSSVASGVGVDADRGHQVAPTTNACNTSDDETITLDQFLAECNRSPRSRVRKMPSCRGGSRNLRKGEAVPPVPFLSPSSLPFPSPSHPLLLEVGPLKPTRGFGERCQLFQWGPGQSPGRIRIWCTLKLSESHWWHSL